MSEQRILYLDIARVFACCLIVLMHSPHPESGNSGELLVPLGFISASGIGLFFMVSGALLLPTHSSTSVFLKKRLGKIIGPLLFWTFFYTIVKLLSKDISFSNLPKMVLSVPFSAQGQGVLWFIYTLAGLYLISPVISPFLVKCSERELRFYIFLWLLSLCYPFLSLVLDVNRSTTGILYYFSGYVGYFLLGYYLHTYKLKINSFFNLFLVFFPIFILAVWHVFDLNGDFYDIFWYLSIPVPMMSIGWFNILKDYSPKNIGGHFITLLSNCCFGIYLIHIFIMRYLLWELDTLVYDLGGVGQIFITWGLTFLFSFIITFVISLLPFSEYIVGFNYKK